MRALWLADVLRGAGLEVVETAGWQTRGVIPGKPQTAAQRLGEFERILGHMAHHTASPTVQGLAVNLHVVTNGNGIAAGPIANVLLWRDGTYYVIASGRCNHAGAGSLPWVPGSGNDYLMSTEAVNNGVGEPWSADMMAAYEIGTAAILRQAGLGAERATTHAEWTTRKIDPAGPNGNRVAVWTSDPRGARNATWDPSAWRAAVGRWLVPPPVEVVPDPPAPPTEEADDMPPIITNADPHPVYGSPGTARFVLMESGRLRHITTLAELSARGNKPGIPWTNAELAAAGIA